MNYGPQQYHHATIGDPQKSDCLLFFSHSGEKKLFTSKHQSAKKIFERRKRR